MDLTRTETPKSSNIRGFEYDPEAKRLTVEFHSGGRYAYDGVPQHEHEAFVGAASHGKHFHRRIKGRFTTTKLN